MKYPTLEEGLRAADNSITQDAINMYQHDINRLANLYYGLFVRERQQHDVDLGDFQQVGMIAVWNVSRRKPELFENRGYVNAAIRYAIFGEMKKMRHKEKQAYLVREHEKEVQLVDVLPTEAKNNERFEEVEELLYTIKHEFSPKDAEGLKALLERCDNIYDINLSEPPSTETKDRIRIVTRMDLSDKEMLIHAQILLGARKQFPFGHLTEKTKRLMEELFAQGLSVAEIAGRTNVSYPTAYGYTKAKERGFASRANYHEHLAKERGFASLTEYREYLAKERGFVSYSKYRDHLAKERSFASHGKYREYLAKERGFVSLREYQEHLVKKRGFASLSEYQEHLLKERGFVSYYEYSKYLAKQRQQNPKNQKLSDLIKQRLAELSKTRKWLAQQLGISQPAVFGYISGSTTPRISLQKKLFETLELPYQTLDDILK